MSDDSFLTSESIVRQDASSMTRNVSLVLRVDASIPATGAIVLVSEATKPLVDDTIPQSDAFVAIDGAIVVTNDASMVLPEA